MDQKHWKVRIFAACFCRTKVRGSLQRRVRVLPAESRCNLRLWIQTTILESFESRKLDRRASGDARAGLEGGWMRRLTAPRRVVAMPAGPFCACCSGRKLAAVCKRQLRPRDTMCVEIRVLYYTTKQCPLLRRGKVDHLCKHQPEMLIAEGTRGLCCSRTDLMCVEYLDVLEFSQPGDQ